MLRHGLIFVPLALISAVVGFGLSAGLAAVLAKVGCALFVSLFLLALTHERRAPGATSRPNHPVNL